MAKELIISANVHEKKVSVIEDGVVTEFYVERRDENQGVVGNLYKGRVMKVLPGMQSAFVDIGLERDAFLYVSDFAEFMEEEGEIDFKETAEDRRSAPSRTEDTSRRRGRHKPEIAAVSRKPELERVEEEETASLPIEDVVEQLAEIADESVIAPPAEDEDEESLAAAPVEGAWPSTEEVSEADVTVIEETAEAESAEALEEAPKRKTRRTRSRKKAAQKTEETEKPRTARRTRKKKEEPEEEETAAAVEGIKIPFSSAPSTARRKTAKSTAKRPSRKRKPAAEKAEKESEQTDRSSEPESKFQRVTDDDLIEDAGDLLKDAIVQEKIIERVHTTEYATTPPEPETEWRVGSYRARIETDSDFQRVVDVEAEASSGEDDGPPPSLSDEFEEPPVSPFLHISDVIPGSLYEQVLAELSGDRSAADSLYSPDDDSQESALGAEASRAAEENRDAGEREERGEEADEEDKQAKVRSLEGRAEFAVRRGGRGRRRRRDAPSDGSAEEEGEKSPPTKEAKEEPPERAEADTSRSRKSVPVSSIKTLRPESAEADTHGARPTRRQDMRHSRRPDARGKAEVAPGRAAVRGAPTISDLLHEGQEILVQIAKEPIAKKGARITSHIALPGRYLVYMPTVNHVGVSRKINSEVERVRLKRIVTALRDREGATGGFIARTACSGHSEQELQDDMRYLLRTWADVRQKAERNKAPALVHRDLDLVQRILRDQLSEDFSAIRIDNEIEYARIVEFVNRVQPRLVKRVKLYTGSQPILERHGVQAEIDKAVKPRVWLKSGGYIVINQTEALVAIDVNTGKFVGKSDKLEDTITRTNMEAAKEIVRQIRLRDLGGIIVIDFIDMDERKNRQRVMTALQQELHTDRAPSKILSINDFGLVAITRKRVKQSLERTLCTPCPYCQGAGMVKSPQTMCFEILEQAKAIAKELSGSSDIMLRVSPDVAEAFRSSERAVLEEIEAYFGMPVTIEADANLHQEQYDFAVM